MVLCHQLGVCTAVREAGHLQEVYRNFGGLGQEVLEVHDRPAKRNLAMVGHLSFLVLNHHRNHSRPLLVLSRFHLLLYRLLNLFLLYVKSYLLSTS